MAHSPAMAASSASPIPLCAGIGLRFPHHEAVLQRRPRIAWLEVHAENYFGGGTARRVLRDIRRDYPVSVHGVGLSLGSAGDLDLQHLTRLRELVRAVEPGLVSEHLSWSVVNGHYLGDLLPLPMTQEALGVVCRHVTQTQEFLQRRILLENPSSYLQFPHSTIPEWEFLGHVAQRTGCGILCDVNNIFVSARNHRWNPEQYLAALPAASVGEIHLAGHARRALADGSEILIDNHGSPVSEAVWSLYAAAIARFGPVPTLIEWDTDIPSLDVLLNEAARADAALKIHAIAA